MNELVADSKLTSAERGELRRCRSALRRMVVAYWVGAAALLRVRAERALPGNARHVRGVVPRGARVYLVACSADLLGRGETKTP